MHSNFEKSKSTANLLAWATRNKKQILLLCSVMILSAFIYNLHALMRSKEKQLTVVFQNCQSQLIVIPASEIRSIAEPLSCKSIPSQKIIHQSWKTKELPKRFDKWSKSWPVCFPEWTYYLWTDEDNFKFVKRYYSQFLPVYESLPSNISRADAVRYMYLHKFGGLYADLDAECLKPFENILRPTGDANSRCDIIFSSMHHDRSKWVQNSFMYANTIGHPFWLELLVEIERRNKVEHELVESVTGPVMLMDVLERTHQKYKICIKSEKLFNPFSWTWGKSNYETGKENKFPYCKDLNRMTDDDLDKCKKAFPEAYVIQYHTQSWKAGNVT